MNISVLSRMDLRVVPIEPTVYNLKNYSSRLFKEKKELIIHFKIFDHRLNSAFFNKLVDMLPKSKIALVDPDGMFGIDYPIYAVVTDFMEISSIDDVFKLLDDSISEIKKEIDNGKRKE